MFDFSLQKGASSTPPFACTAAMWRRRPSQLKRGSLDGAPTMTRFKELRRLEAALERGDLAELRWGLEFCNEMLRSLRLKSGVDMWRKLKSQVLEKIEEVRG